MRKIFLYCSVIFVACMLWSMRGANETETSKVVVAYVTSWSDVVPNPYYMTHINYSFGHVADSFDSVRIDNPERLELMVALKKINPELKVMLSVGGWGSGNFSEMAADPQKRASFCRSCREAVDKYNLDGIDIDWEYPTRSDAGISSSEDDTQNFTLLMRDLRKELGDSLQLTLATVASGEYIDMAAIAPYIDFVNIMAYDMGNPPYLHNGLYPSSHTPAMTSSRAVENHLKAGLPRDKVVLGMPLYGRGHREVLNDSAVIIQWDDSAKVPYAVMCDTLALGFENVRSITYKCNYVLDQNLHGAMYWEYNSETGDHPMALRIKEMILDRHLYPNE